MNFKSTCTVALTFVFTSCTDENQSQLRMSESFIDAFYSFQLTELKPFVENAQSSAPSIIYYQGWAEGGNYKILDRLPCETVEPNNVECSIMVEDDPVLALGSDFKVTDTFTITFANGKIIAVETSSNDQPIYYEAFDWVTENMPEVMAGPCQGFFEAGPTPSACARAMTDGYAQFAASEDFPRI